MSKSNYDQYLTIFSPEGSLFQVEYSYKAVKATGITAVAVRCAEGAVVACQRKVPDKLIKPESICNVFDLNGNIGACIIGRVPDGRFVLDSAREIAFDFKYDFGHPIPVNLLAKRLAGQAQYNTQVAQTRAMGVSMTLIGMDKDDVSGLLQPQLFKVDPSGHFVGYYALASGAKEIEANSQLEKAMKEKHFRDMSLAEATECVLSTLQHVSGEALKGKDIELGCVSTTKPQFHMIDADTIDATLTAIAERD